MSKEKTLFEKLYEGADSIKKALKRPLAERSMKRKFQSAYDDAARIIDEEELALHNEREMLHECDVNDLLTSRRRIEDCITLQENIKKEYLEMFGEEYSCS
tara:strand:- start:509 stop:811 length:303 start_codon:yes stop_codon:yes gene_type:complete